MEPVTYTTADLYIENRTTLAAKIIAIEAVIAALIVTATQSAATANFDTYFLDDGQTKIQTKYRDASDVFKAINQFERLKQLYINQLNGHTMRLVDGKNFL